jgi:thiol:disulfide interchange protein DsbD
VWAALPSVVAACGEPAVPDAAAANLENLVRIRAVPDVVRVAPGEAFCVAVVFEIEPKWHIYWKNPGAGAMAPRVTLEAPPGFEVGQPLWPRPSVVDSPLGPEYSYFEEVALFIPVTAPDRLVDGSVTLRADVDWAVCSNVCRLGSARQDIVVATTGRPHQAPTPPVDEPAIERYRRRLPRELQWPAVAESGPDGTTVTVRGEAKGLTEITFLPDDCPGVVYGEWAGIVQDDRFELRIPVEIQPNNALGERMAVRGLVALGRGLDDPCYDFELDLGADPDLE